MLDVAAALCDAMCQCAFFSLCVCFVVSHREIMCVCVCLQSVCVCLESVCVYLESTCVCVWRVRVCVSGEYMCVCMESTWVCMGINTHTPPFRILLILFFFV
eukprot:GHVR01108577.1.p1 GENE.GHVR01108577.1~~GHVR01108577.1.p1  ORF type:complete len:102 (-),score=49.85 GHVR01108577.1:1-306(-)